jgi:cell shape-determining protein MreC
MTDEERQQLINSLRNYHGYDRELTKLVHNAADELERLAAENEQLRDELDYVEHKG